MLTPTPVPFPIVPTIALPSAETLKACEYTAPANEFAAATGTGRATVRNKTNMRNCRIMHD
jgi:hypothetical protein